MNSPITSTAGPSPDGPPGDVLPNHQLELRQPQDSSPIPLLCLPCTIALVPFRHHLDAAEALSSNLDGLGVRHAYIGNFAWALLGSTRPVKICLLHENSRGQRAARTARGVRPSFHPDRKQALLHTAAI
ncbi:hypothetical protein GY45DRAFT_883531 [Cubamyces sp. BRFM 1775]|nr:hypothetical protein GY45DRAFT_883531 [Cubamyces sp. BRFM 1775]